MRLRESTEGQDRDLEKGAVDKLPDGEKGGLHRLGTAGWQTLILLKTNQTQKHFSLDNIIQLKIFLSINKPIEFISVIKMPRILSRILVVGLVRTNHIISSSFRLTRL
jgi:hypothetical protein